MIFVRTKNFLITKGKFLPAIWRQSEAKHRHAGDQEAGDDQVGEVVEGPPPDLDAEGDVQVRFGTAVVDDLITNGRNSWRKVAQIWIIFCQICSEVKLVFDKADLLMHFEK